MKIRSYGKYKVENVELVDCSRYIRVIAHDSMSDIRYRMSSGFGEFVVYSNTELIRVHGAEGIKLPKTASIMEDRAKVEESSFGIDTVLHDYIIRVRHCDIKDILVLWRYATRYIRFSTIYKHRSEIAHYIQ